MAVIVPVSEAVLDWLLSKKHLTTKERENRRRAHEMRNGQF
jgi:hypothetical protein